MALIRLPERVRTYRPTPWLMPVGARRYTPIVASNLLFRLGFLAYLGEAITDVALTFLLFVLLRPVHTNLAFLAVLFRVMATATFAFAELFYFAPSLILGGDGYLKAFSPDQLNSLALLSLNVYQTAGNLFLLFYGIGSIILGYLMFRSGYLPRVVGGLWVFGGLGFVIGNVVWIFTPANISLLLLPQIIALLSLGLWLLVRAVDTEKWNQAAVASSLILKATAIRVVPPRQSQRSPSCVPGRRIGEPRRSLPVGSFDR
jgi:hypothetical protein